MASAGLPEVAPRRVGVLVSGRGSNLQALLDACVDGFPARVVRVVSNIPGVYALERAARAGVPTCVLPHAGVPRPAFDAALRAQLLDDGVDIVCLAGFMRVLGPGFLEGWPVINVHPALLPAFPGLHGPRQAIAAGVVQAGATVHLVDAGVDTGPILGQATVAVTDDDTEDSLAARILPFEHRLFVQALRQVAEGRVRVEGRRAHIGLKPGEQRWLQG